MQAAGCHCRQGAAARQLPIGGHAGRENIGSTAGKAVCSEREILGRGDGALIANRAGHIQGLFSSCVQRCAVVQAGGRGSEVLGSIEVAAVGDGLGIDRKVAALALNACGAS